MTKLLNALNRDRSWLSAYSLLIVGSLFSAFSVLSTGSAGSILSIGGAGQRRAKARRN